MVILYCGVHSSYPMFPAFLLAWSCSVAVIFRVAGYGVGSVVSPRGEFCMGTLPVDIRAVSDVGSMVISVGNT
jgi:hypothetical protein